MKQAIYCTFNVEEKTRRNYIHKMIDRIYKSPEDHTPCPRWCSNGTMVEVVSADMPLHPEQVATVEKVTVPTGKLTLTFQYPAIRHKDGRLKVYDSPEIAKKRICEKVSARLAEMGMNEVDILDYVHNTSRIDLSDRDHGVSKLPVSFIVASCSCEDEYKVLNLMVNGIGKFRFAGLGMVYVTKA
jgi:hypothetical protein